MHLLEAAREFSEVGLLRYLRSALQIKPGSEVMLACSVARAEPLLLLMIVAYRTIDTPRNQHWAKAMTR